MLAKSLPTPVLKNIQELKNDANTFPLPCRSGKNQQSARRSHFVSRPESKASWQVDINVECPSQSPSFTLQTAAYQRQAEAIDRPHSSVLMHRPFIPPRLDTGPDQRGDRPNQQRDETYQCWWNPYLPVTLSSLAVCVAQMHDILLAHDGLPVPGHN